MDEKYEPRTVAIVALASLVVGFVAVFGGGMLLLRPRSRDTSAAAEPAPPAARPRPAARDGGGAATTTASAAGEPGAGAAGEESDAGARAPVTAAGVTLSPASTSRCFNQGNPAPIAGAQCDQLAGLDQHIASKAADIAACARGGATGRLSLVLDFRFSTSFMRGWGSPTSSIANAGNVSACVKTAITPLPFATIPHQHDRYLVVVGIDWGGAPAGGGGGPEGGGPAIVQ